MDIANEVALILHELGEGVYDPDGTEGNIYIDHNPNTVDVIFLIQNGGLPRDLKYRGDIRYPFLHIEYQNTSPSLVRNKLNKIVSLLEQETFHRPEGNLTFRMQAEPVPFKISDELYKGTLDFTVTTYIKGKIN